MSGRGKRDGEGGYALVAAVAAIAAFAYIAFEVLAVNRGAIAGVGAEFSRARLAAAAEAGVAIAAQGLSVQGTSRWPIDGRSRTVELDGARIAVVVEDEKGKAPLNKLDENDVRGMFAAAGASGSRLNGLVDAFEDWQDEDDARRASGAERADYMAAGLRPRNGAMHTVDELAALKGMDGAMFARLKPALTVFPGERGGFSASTANPLAIAFMTEGGQGATDAIQRQRELAGEQTALPAGDQPSLVGRPLTVRVTASDGHGGEARRAAIIQLTGRAGRPYWVRFVE